MNFSIENGDIRLSVEKRLVRFLSLDIIDIPSGNTLETIFIPNKQIELFTHLLLGVSDNNTYVNGEIYIKLEWDNEIVHVSVNSIPPISRSAFKRDAIIKLAEAIKGYAIA